MVHGGGIEVDIDKELASPLGRERWGRERVERGLIPGPNLAGRQGVVSRDVNEDVLAMNSDAPLAPRPQVRNINSTSAPSTCSISRPTDLKLPSTRGFLRSGILSEPSTLKPRT